MGGEVWKIINPNLPAQRPSITGAAAPTVAEMVSRAQGTAHARVRAARQCAHMFDVYYNAKKSKSYFGLKQAADSNSCIEALDPLSL